MTGDPRPRDPAVHAAALEMAKKFIWTIQAILREEERIDAFREAYSIAREGLETFQSAKEQPCDTK